MRESVGKGESLGKDSKWDSEPLTSPPRRKILKIVEKKSFDLRLKKLKFDFGGSNDVSYN